MIRAVLAPLVCGLAGASPVAASRDPFSPPAPLGDVGTPLQQVEIDQLRLVALVYDPHAPRALLEDGDGIGYVVTLGTPVGRDGGTVVGIERRKLRIRTFATESEVVLELPAREGRP